MAALPVTEELSENRELHQNGIEIVEFATQSTDGDYYLCRKLGNADFVFASQMTGDHNEIKLGISKNANGQQKVTITPQDTAVTTGYLVVFGRV